MNTATSVRPNLLDSVYKFTDAFGDGGLASEIAPTLNCAEVEALANLFRALGHTEIADVWVSEHLGSTGEDIEEHLEDAGDSSAERWPSTADKD
ncbi:hypothetical protein P5W11_06530 [Mycobacteroides abscessus subsp. bolletii]|uniref:hypothetical protein n=1 Tax=Mycobacteroides abscessus TaxID=36809 RepID=UPI0009A8BD80|nr:hypothetical protein [Mycobacteroides abscessus]MDO3067877.1 hypothetical protein [Mycobacteroides abscessus subsp. bolletii]SLD44377.1 Uncharacterised protein [Mycobacteroides abscessus subsp. bolletii]